MYCTHCGKQIENNSKFCPYCGGSLSTSDTDSAKEALKKTAGTVMDSAKMIGNKVNEATNGQAQKYAEKAKETAKGFTDDVKQVAKDKDASNFFTKNKYRNVKIIAVLLIAVFLLSTLLGGDKSEKMAKNLVSTKYPDCKIISVTKALEHEKLGHKIYIVKIKPPKENEHSVLVWVEGDNSFVDFMGIYQNNRYNQMEKELDEWAIAFEMGSK